jgi:hypothetical protein
MQIPKLFITDNVYEFKSTTTENKLNTNEKSSIVRPVNIVPVHFAKNVCA